MTKILFLGDLYYDYNEIVKDLDNIEKYIKENNLKCILNLEGPITESIVTYTSKRGPNLKQSKSVVEVLKKLNVIGVTLSNNHMFDFCEKGILDTIDILQKNNIKFCGCGRNLEEALKPMVFDFESKKVAIYSYGWDVEETHYAKKQQAGCAPLNKKIITNNISKNMINIVQLHWGFEFNKYPMPRDIKFAHSFIDSGASLVIGHHPHNIQPFEMYKEKNIYYSLGNFYFSSRSMGFNKIELDNNIQNYCNYGVGIVYDVNAEKVVDTIEFYNDVDKRTVIFSDRKIIKPLEYSPNIEKEYLKKVKESKCNKNPILTGTPILDRIKIVILYIKFFLIRIKYSFKEK